MNKLLKTSVLSLSLATILFSGSVYAVDVKLNDPAPEQINEQPVETITPVDQPTQEQLNTNDQAGQNTSNQSNLNSTQTNQTVTQTTPSLTPTPSREESKEVKGESTENTGTKPVKKPNLYYYLFLLIPLALIGYLSYQKVKK